MLARLRKLFGDPLFVRQQRGIHPTPRALALAPALKEWLSKRTRSSRATDSTRRRRRSPRHWQPDDYIQTALIVPFIQKLRRLAPNAQLGLRSTQLPDVTAMLADGTLDLCVTNSRELPRGTCPRACFTTNATSGSCARAIR